METPRVAIVIPAYNEEKTIASVINKVSAFGDVIVVNDCSNDNTEDESIKSGAIVVNHIVNKGYDGALNSGFYYASEQGYNYVITFDADGQHSEESLTDYIKHLQQYQLVLGVRPECARLSERIFSWLTNRLYGVKDPLCGMKGYRIELYDQLGYFDEINSIGTELALTSIKNNCSYIQLSIPITEREDAPRFGRILRANIIILQAMYRYLKKYYW